MQLTNIFSNLALNFQLELLHTVLLILLAHQGYPCQTFFLADFYLALLMKSLPSIRQFFCLYCLLYSYPLPRQ